MERISLTFFTFESGQWLLVPVTAKPNNKATVARQAAILHGATFIATGEAPGIERNAGKPTIDPIDTTPVLLSGGPLDDKYLKQIADTKPPHGFPEGSVKNPDLVLTNRLLTQEVLDYVQFCVSAKLDIPAAPPNSLNALSSGNVSPGISNIPFLDQNAQVREVNSTFYVAHVEGVGGSSFMQLQYTQRVILRFAGIGLAPCVCRDAAACSLVVGIPTKFERCKIAQLIPGKSRPMVSF